MVPRVLIVDDEENWRETFRDIMVTLGYDVDVFEKFDEVKNALNTTKYDLALLDIALLEGDLNSPRAFVDFDRICRLLHEVYPQLPIVAVSGKSNDPEYMFNLPRHEGLKGFVSKNDKNLVATLQNLIKEMAPLQTDTELDELHYCIEDQQ